MLTVRNWVHTGISSAQASPANLQFIWMTILLTTLISPLSFFSVLNVTHCVTTGASTQHCFLMASYISFLLVGRTMRISCTDLSRVLLMASKNAAMEVFSTAALKSSNKVISNGNLQKAPTLIYYWHEHLLKITKATLGRKVLAVNFH